MLIELFLNMKLIMKLIMEENFPRLLFKALNNDHSTYLITEAATKGVIKKAVLLEILQYSQENTKKK